MKGPRERLEGGGSSFLVRKVVGATSHRELASVDYRNLVSCWNLFQRENCEAVEEES
jgi:hypothetical protein